ncbi:hypothetical protein ACHAWF_007341 [Thalassiosira exigua]
MPPRLSQGVHPRMAR